MSDPANQTLRRIALGVALPAFLLVAALLPLWLFRARLPEPLATHWSMRGQPNGAMPLATFLLLIAVLTGIAAAGTYVLAHRRRAGRGEISGLMAVTACMGGMIAMTSWKVTAANLDVLTWKQADPLGFSFMLLSLVASIALGIIAARLSRALETTSLVDAADIPSAGLAPGARAMWVGTARTTWATPVAIVFFALALLVQLWIPAVGLIHVAIGLVCLLFTSIRVTIDRSGLRIAYGLFGWPVQRVPLAQIRQASTLQVHPMEWGGWGYRGSLRVMRRAAVVLRAGEGMRLELAGERTLVITVDGAQQGAGLVNDLLAAARPAASVTATR